MAPISQVSTEEKNNGGTTATKTKMIGCNPVLWEVKSSIRGVMDELQALSNTEKTVISLGTGDPTAYPQFLGGRPPFIDSLSSAFTSSLTDSYAPSFGLPPARRAVAEHLTKVLKLCARSEVVPFHVSDSDVFLTSGATQAIHLVITILSSAGGNILLPRPGFPLYDSACDLAGVRRRYYDLLPSRRWEADPTHIRSLADDRTLAIVVINPNNPSGATFSAHHLFQIAEIARDLNIPIIADEVYGGMVFGGVSFVPMASFAHLAPVITIGSLAKRWMVPGWRLGWLVICDPQGTLQRVREATEILMNLYSGPASAIQAAVPTVLSDANEKFHENVVMLLELCAETLCRGLEKIEVLRCYCRPQGSMFMMVEVDTTRLLGIESDMDFAKELMKEESVLVVPGSILGLKNWVRLFFGLPAGLLNDACDRMISFCKRRMINSWQV
ncbi:hypothetical protein M5K25_003281 [Dendrobium thyrsiflorum]|uniref:Aminotransferase class I/classII large domain-containing protein n=1 Tax=Dendrobium thyrsiflorum TaxID=117978 RepID=A0ABD0VR63_DENTH